MRTTAILLGLLAVASAAVVRPINDDCIALPIGTEVSGSLFPSKYALLPETTEVSHLFLQLHGAWACRFESVS